MGPTWGLSAPDGPHVGPMNFIIRDVTCRMQTEWAGYNVILQMFSCVALLNGASSDVLNEIMYVLSLWKVMPLAIWKIITKITILTVHIYFKYDCIHYNHNEDGSLQLLIPFIPRGKGSFVSNTNFHHRCDLWRKLLNTYYQGGHQSYNDSLGSCHYHRILFCSSKLLTVQW